MNKLLFAISTLTALVHSPAFAGDFCSTLHTVKDCAEASCTWLDDEQRCTDNSGSEEADMERETGFEPATYGLGSRRSTN